MIANGTLVRKAPEQGSYALVETLKVGDSVYDPFAKKSVEILYILSRTIDFLHQKWEERHPLYPVVLAPGALGAKRPARPVVVSPQQEVFFKQPNETGDSKSTIEFLTAEHISAEYQMFEDCAFPAVTYFAIFTERMQLLECSGLLLRTFPANIFAQPLSGPREGEKLSDIACAGYAQD